MAYATDLTDAQWALAAPFIAARVLMAGSQLDLLPASGHSDDA